MISTSWYVHKPILDQLQRRCILTPRRMQNLSSNIGKISGFAKYLISVERVIALPMTAVLIGVSFLVSFNTFSSFWKVCIFKISLLLMFDEIYSSPIHMRRKVTQQIRCPSFSTPECPSYPFWCQNL